MRTMANHPTTAPRTALMTTADASIAANGTERRSPSRRYVSRASTAEDDRDGDRQRDDEYDHDDEQLGPCQPVTLFCRGLPRHLHRIAVSCRGTCERRRPSTEPHATGVIACFGDGLEKTTSTTGTTTVTASEVTSATLLTPSYGSRWVR